MENGDIYIISCHFFGDLFFLLLVSLDRKRFTFNNVKIPKELKRERYT